MKPFVLDATVALGWTLDNPVPSSATRAKQALLSGTRAVAPALWHLEIANGLAVAERRGILTSSDAMLALLQLEQLCAQALEIEADIVPMLQALTTARAYQLSACDSVYLDWRFEPNCLWQPLDVALRKAAGKAGVDLLH
jgi:predicted nucleic acid-binding protein